MRFVTCLVKELLAKETLQNTSATWTFKLLLIGVDCWFPFSGGRTAKGCDCALVPENVRKFLTWKKSENSCRLVSNLEGFFSVFPRKLSNLTPKSLAGFWHSPYQARVMDVRRGQGNDCAWNAFDIEMSRFFPHVPCQPRRGCISLLVKATAATTSMMIQICGSHLAASYQRSGVHAFLAGQEMGQSVKNVQKLWFTL